MAVEGNDLVQVVALLAAGVVAVASSSSAVFALGAVIAEPLLRGRVSGRKRNGSL
jgi:hypothetical protein